MSLKSNAYPTPLPKYIYKILPSSPAPPSPLPANLPLSSLDRGDGFMHFSTSVQLISSLNHFFKNETHVWIARVPYERVKEFVQWETTKGVAATEKFEEEWGYEVEKSAFPHVYGNGEEGDEKRLRLGEKEVDEVGKWEKVGEKWGNEGWPFGEDVPKMPV